MDRQLLVTSSQGSPGLRLQGWPPARAVLGGRLRHPPGRQHGARSLVPRTVTVPTPLGTGLRQGHRAVGVRTSSLRWRPWRTGLAETPGAPHVSLGLLRSRSSFSVFLSLQPPRPLLSMLTASERPPRHTGDRRSLCVNALSSSLLSSTGPQG